MTYQVHPKATVLASEGPARPEDLRAAEERFGTLPPEYVELVKEATEVEITFENGRYLRVWGPQGLVEMDESYGISARLTGAVPVGDDGGGRFIYYGSGRDGRGLNLCGYGDIDSASSMWWENRSMAFSDIRSAWSGSLRVSRADPSIVCQFPSVRRAEG